MPGIFCQTHGRLKNIAEAAEHIMGRCIVETLPMNWKGEPLRHGVDYEYGGTYDKLT